MDKELDKIKVARYLGLDVKQIRVIKGSFASYKIMYLHSLTTTTRGGAFLHSGAHNNIYAVKCSDDARVPVVARIPRLDHPLPLADSLSSAKAHAQVAKAFPKYVPALKEVSIFQDSHGKSIVVITMERLEIRKCPWAHMWAPVDPRYRLADKAVIALLVMTAELLEGGFNHGDISANNIEFTPQGAKVFDFDKNTKILEGEIPNPNLFTWGKMAPETLSSDRVLHWLVTVTFKQGAAMLERYYRLIRVAAAHHRLEGDEFSIFRDIHDPECYDALNLWNQYYQKEGALTCQKCKYEASQIYTYAAAVYYNIIKGKDYSVIDLLEPQVHKLLFDCLHPLPERRPTVSELLMRARALTPPVGCAASDPSPQKFRSAEV